jgi:glutamate-ammonia-ligase adenylyltransferase
LAARGTGEIARIVRLQRDPRKVLADVLEMRGMVEEAKGGEGAWDLKQAPGGLVDIEFIAQALELVHAAAHPEIVATDTEASLQAAADAGVLDRGAADVLLPALRLQSDLMQILRLCVAGAFVPDDAPAALRDRLAEAADLPDFRTLDAHLRATQAAVRTCFDRLIGKVPVKAGA